MTTDLVLGAGIAGLATAFHLAAAGRDVVVLEASDRAGGVIRTVRHGAAVLEQGPQSAMATPEVLALIGHLGLRDRLRTADPAAHHRFVLHRGALHPVPTSPRAAWRSPLIGPSNLLRALAEPFIGPRSSRTPESVADLLSRRVGPGVLPLAEAAIGGILAGDPSALDAEASFGGLVAAEREHGSLLRGLMHRPRTPPGQPRGSITLAGGLEQLVDALRLRLGSRLRLGCPVERIERTANGWQVHADRTWSTDRLWLCVPPWTAARLLHEPALDIPAAPVAAVHLAYPREALPPLPGFGWLVAPAQRRDVLGCLWVSSIFPGHAPGLALLRVMIGGARAPDLTLQPPAALVADARRVLADVQGITLPPLFTDVSVATPGIPQYPVGHAARVRAILSRHPRLHLVGWGSSGVGLTHILKDAAQQTLPLPP